MAQDQSFVCVPIRAEVYNEFILRMGKSIDHVAEWIEDVVIDYLDRTREDGPWCDAYFESIGLDEDPIQVRRREYGPPNEGYQWQSVLLPNGTEIRMQYRGEYQYAAIKHRELIYNGQPLSPSEFARMVANNTSRNAWRDVELKFPDADDWTLADVIRRERRLP